MLCNFSSKAFSIPKWYEMTWESDWTYCCVTFNNYLYFIFVCFYIISPFFSFFFFPFVKRLLVIEIMNRFCFCFDSIKVSDKFKLKNLFIKSPFSSLWIDIVFCDWMPERSCQEKVHWRTLCERFFSVYLLETLSLFFFSCYFWLCTLLCCPAILPSTRLSKLIFIYNQVLYSKRNGH